jgi:hypothetical protein
MYAAVMWGSGHLLPNGKSAFELQFEPTGIDRAENIKGYLYRRNMEGRGVRVTFDEYIHLVGTFSGYVLLRGFFAIVIFVASAAIFLLIEPTIYVGDWSGISLLLGLVPAALYCGWQRRRDWQRIDDKLAGRKKVGLDRSAEEAKMMRLALSNWVPFWYCAAIPSVPALAAFQNGARPQAHDWFWLAPLGIIIIGGLGWWSFCKLRALRTYRDRYET